MDPDSVCRDASGLVSAVFFHPVFILSALSLSPFTLPLSLSPSLSLFLCRCSPLCPLTFHPLPLYPIMNASLTIYIYGVIAV